MVKQYKQVDLRGLLNADDEGNARTSETPGTPRPTTRRHFSVDKSAVTS